MPHCRIHQGRTNGILPVMRRLARSIAVLLALLAVLSAVALASAYVYLRQSLPKVEGEVPAPGLKAAVEVLRDAYPIRQTNSVD